MTAKRNKEIQSIKEGLHSSEDVLNMRALSDMEKKGDVSLLADVIELWANSDEQVTKSKAESIMFGLKDKNALTELVNYLSSSNSEEKKWLAINGIWQSGFDASQHLTALIEFAIANSYTAAIDIMTIIENSEFSEDQEELVDQNIKMIHGFVATSKSDIVPLLMEINSILINKKIEG